MYRCAAEEGEPDHSEGRGQQQVHDGELADCTAVGHAREEHAGDGCPGVPYREEEERPDAREGVAAYRGEEKVAAEERLDIVGEPFEAEVDVEYRRPDYEDEAEEYEEELAVDVADESHAALDAGAAGSCVYHYHKKRYRAPREPCGGDAELRVEAARDLEHAFAERRYDAAREREYYKCVEYLSPETLHLFAENGNKGGAYRARGFHVVEGVGAGDSAYGVHRVGRQRPFEEYLREREARRLFGEGHDAEGFRRVHELHDWLRRAPEDYADRDSGAERHREPVPVAVFELRVLAAEFYVAVAREHEEERQQADEQRRERVEPSEGVERHVEEVRQEGYRLSFVAHPDDEAVGRRYGKQDERREKGVDSYILHNVSLSFIKMPRGRIL